MSFPTAGIRSRGPRRAGAIKGKCKKGKNHDTETECDAKGDNYVWCGAS